MKKILNILLITLILIFTACGKVTEEQARKALSENLVKRYGEEFCIGYMGRRSDGKDTWYQAKIYPKKYEGTPREYDEYYHRNGTVDIKKGIFGESIDYVGDTYRIVLMNESANKFYLPKLKELFGENVLPVLDINIAELSIYPDFLVEIKERMKAGGHPQIKGGIYIFGRVENDEDREWYRQQIYEFVQFMKQTGTFEYVDIEFYIRDERMLSKGFNNSSDREKMKELGNAIVTKTRNKIYQKYDEDYKNTPQKYKDKWLENVRKSNVKEDTFGVSLLYSRITSPKYIKSNGWDTDRDMQFELKEYNDLKDIKFDLEGWKNQE